MPIEGLPVARGYDFQLVALSVVIAVLASAAALDLAGRVTAARGRARRGWLAGGALVMGLGIWSMHYTGMLALRLPVPVRYHLPTVALSLAAAIVAATVALWVASRERLTPGRIAVGSLAMGSGIAAMHYIGMAGMRLPAMMHWSLLLVAVSIVIAIVVSAVALWLAFRFGHAVSEVWSFRKVVSAAVMGAAIPSMHYTGMAAANFSPSDIPVNLSNTVGTSVLGDVAVVGVTLVVLMTAIASSMVNRRLAAQALKLQFALAEVKTLRGMLPICAHCKRVRDGQGSWEQIEVYVRRHTEAVFSHGMCPECAEEWEKASMA